MYSKYTKGCCRPTAWAIFLHPLQDGGYRESLRTVCYRVIYIIQNVLSPKIIELLKIQVRITVRVRIEVRIRVRVNSNSNSNPNPNPNANLNPNPNLNPNSNRNPNLNLK